MLVQIIFYRYRNTDDDSFIAMEVIYMNGGIISSREGWKLIYLHEYIFYN